MKYTKSDFADTCTVPWITLSFIHTGFSGIQTHDLCLVTGTPSLPKSAVSKTLISNEPGTVLNLFYDS